MFGHAGRVGSVVRHVGHLGEAQRGSGRSADMAGDADRLAIEVHHRPTALLAADAEVGLDHAGKGVAHQAEALFILPHALHLAQAAVGKLRETAAFLLQLGDRGGLRPAADVIAFMESSQIGDRR